MRLIDADAIKFDSGFPDGTSRDDYAMAFARIVQAVKDAPTVDAVPLAELIALRDTLYDTDEITLRGIYKLNKLIAKYDSKEAKHEKADRR